MISKDGISVDDLKSMPQPKIECSVTFNLKKNHNKAEIEKILNKKCLYSVTYDEQMENLKEKKIDTTDSEGYIAFDFGSIDSYDGETIVKNAVNYLYERKDEIKKLNESLDGEIEILLDVFLTSFNNPYVIIEKDTIKKMAELNIWLDQSIDFYSPWHFKKLIDKFEYENVEENDDNDDIN